MNIEERITKLEHDSIELKARIDMLSKMEHYVTPAELAKILNCSKNHIYIQIRSGAIQAVTVGAAIRIPMSQFEMNQISNKKPNRKQHQPEIQNEKRSINHTKKTPEHLILLAFKSFLVKRETGFEQIPAYTNTDK